MSPAKAFGVAPQASRFAQIVVVVEVNAGTLRAAVAGVVPVDDAGRSAAETVHMLLGVVWVNVAEQVNAVQFVAQVRRFH
jgi:hypothetical protein